MIIQHCKSDHIENWQDYLQGKVADHPAWRSFPQIGTPEIDPSKPICVGYWEGGNSLPNANELIGSGTIADLLKLVDNPKSNTVLSHCQPGGNKGRRPNESIRIGIQYIFEILAMSRSTRLMKILTLHPLLKRKDLCAGKNTRKPLN